MNALKSLSPLRGFLLALGLLLSKNSPAALWVTSNPAIYIDFPSTLALSGSNLFLSGYTLNSGTFVFDGRVEKRALADASLLAAFDGDGILTQSQPAQNFMTTHLIEEGGALYIVSMLIVGSSTTARIEKRDATTGVLDASFGSGGVLDYSVVDGDRPVRVGSDGSFLYVVGSTGPEGSRSALLEKRSLATGALQGGFGSGGQVLVNPSANNDSFVNLAIEGSNLYVCGTYNALSYSTSVNTSFMEKHDSGSGAAVGAFGSAGRITGAFSSWMKVLVTADGLSLLGTEVSSPDTQWGVNRVDKVSGAPLGGFGSGGTQLYNPGGLGDVPTCMATDGSSLFIGGMEAFSSSDTGWRVIKASLSTGAVDSSFYSGAFTYNPTVNGEMPMDILANGTDIYVLGLDTLAGIDSQWRVELLSSVPAPTATITPSFSASPSFSATRSATPSFSPSPLITATPTRTVSATYSPSPTITQTRTATLTSTPGGACAATPITVGSSLIGNTTAGANNFVLPCVSSSGPDHLFSFTLAAPANVRISTCSTNTLYDSTLSLLSSCSPPTSIFCTDDDSSCAANGAASTIQASLAAGTYWILVDGWAGGSGQYELSLSLVATPTLSPSFTRSPTFSASPTITRTFSASPTYSPAPTPVIAGFPYYTGFESGSLGPEWSSSISVPGSGQIQVNGLNTPYAGANHLQLHSNTVYSRQEAVLHVDLTGQSNVVLEFRLKDFNEDIQALPATFTGSYDGDGVAVSQDGVNWVTVLTNVNQTDGVYYFHSFNLMSIMTAAGFSNFSHIRIKFQEYDDFAIPTDGFAFDEISLSPFAATPTPTASASPTSTISPTTTPFICSNLAGLSQTYSPTTALSANLTTEGSLDWAHWGYGGTANAFNHKSSGGSQISNVTGLGGAVFNYYNDSIGTMSWSDGTPQAAVAGTNDGSYVAAPGEGWQFSVPADTSWKTLKVYAGVYSGTSANLYAFLSDGSGSPYSVTFTTAGTQFATASTIYYKAASAGQTLTVRFVNMTGYSFFGAATLSGLIPPCGTPTISPTFSVSPTISPTYSASPLVSPTPTSTPAPGSPTRTPSATPTATRSATPSITPSLTRTASPLPTPTRSATASPTPSPSFTISPTFSASPTVTPTSNRPAAKPGKIYSYPNPFRPGTGLKNTFVFEASVQATLKIYDWAAREIGEASAVFPSAGYAEWDGRIRGGEFAAPGVYFCILRSDKGEAISKFTVVW